MEVGSPRERLAICRRFVEASTFFDYIRTDGEWKYNEFRQDSSKLQPPASRE